MNHSTDQRPKYSTGFKLFVAGWGMIGLGLLLSTQVWEPLGILILLGIPGVWFRNPSDWRKTWPDDFPERLDCLGGSNLSMGGHLPNLPREQLVEDRAREIPPTLRSLADDRRRIPLRLGADRPRQLPRIPVAHRSARLGSADRLVRVRAVPTG